MRVVFSQTKLPRHSNKELSYYFKRLLETFIRLLLYNKVMKRAFIFLYGAELDVFMGLKPKSNEPIICADNGILLAKKLKYKPEDLILIGDLDSVTKDALVWCQKNKFRIIKHPQNKDFTDGHLAIEYACKKYSKETEKIIIGGVTNILDHTLGNILPAINFVEKGHEIKILNKRQNVYLFNSKIEIKDCKNHIISLIPIKETLVIKTDGFKWKLDNEVVLPYQSRTLRNSAVKSKVSIAIKYGVLMVIETW